MGLGVRAVSYGIGEGHRHMSEVTEDDIRDHGGWS